MFAGNARVECQRSTTGGKGNRGKYVDRSKHVCAAGVPTAQANLTIESALHQHLLKDEVDALISDAIIPSTTTARRLPPMRHPPPPDQRHCIFNTEAVNLINPPTKAKFQNIVEDLKDTPYKSYWKTPLGRLPDAVPMFPDGFDIENTTYGKKEPFHDNLYDIVMPKDPLPDRTRPALKAGAQTCRNYCRPAFNPDFTYGYRTNIDKRGILVKCNLTDKNVVEGTAGRTCMNFVLTDFLERKQARLRKALVPNNNINCVPEGYSFGILKPPENLPECLSTCELNPKLEFFRKCLSHLNTLRKVMSTRFLPTFFRKFWLHLKYFDKDKTSWLPKEIVYNYCDTNLIRFDPALIEPLLCVWNAFDGSNIEYKIFANVLNFKQPLPELPKVPDIHPDCLDFRTTYNEMVKPGQASDDRIRAGIPSGRYLDLDYPITPDGYCRAVRTCLSQESDMNSCINPSILTSFNVSHREMYARREPASVRRVFEASGQKFTDETFNQVWDIAKEYHSQGWVCFETFRKALEKYSSSPNENAIKN